MFKKFSQSSIGIILSSIFGVGLIKIISIKSGPETLGYFGVFRQFFQLLTVIFTLGSGFAVIEGIPKAQDKKGFVQSVSGYTFCICLLLSILVFLFATPITLGLFGNLEQLNLIRLLPVMIFSIAYTLLIRSIYSAQGELVLSGIFWSLSYMFMFFVSFFSTELSDLYLYGSLASACVGIALFKDKSLLIPSIKFKRLISFEQTALATAITGITGFFSFMIVRAICVRELGPNAGGFLESSWSLINYTVLIFLTSVSAYYLPQVSERNDDQDFRKKFFNLLNILSIGSLLILCLGKGILIPLLFSEKFLPASDLLIVMSIGEYFKCLNYFFIFSLIGLAKKRSYIILDSIANLSFVLMAFLLPIKSLEFFGYIYLAYQALYLAGSIYLNQKYKIISHKFFFSHLGLGILIWASYLALTYN